MARIINTKPEELEGFGRRLLLLCNDQQLAGPADLAKQLYGNYYEIVKPGIRRNKHGISVKDPAHDLKALTRAVQKHFSLVNGYDVQSHYMYAYSLLFGCSLDYLYGRIDEPSPDAEITDIAQKTGLSAKAVTNLIDNYDSDSDVFSMTRIWSEVLESGLFEEVPMQWFIYCGNKLKMVDLKKKIEAIRKAEPEAGDADYRTMMEIRREALEGLRPMVTSNCEGAFAMLTDTLAAYIKYRTDTWVKEQHKEFDKNYYDNEIRKIEAIEAALKEGSEPVIKHSVRGKGTE